MSMRFIAAASAATAALFVAAQAGAVTFAYTPGSSVAGVGFSPQIGYVVLNEYNEDSDFATITGHDFERHLYASDGDGAQPFFTSPGSTSLLSVLGPAGNPGEATGTFLRAITTSFQFDWG